MNGNQGLHLLNFILWNCTLIALGVWDRHDWWMLLPLVVLQLLALITLWREL
jgi:hypothetical protein